MALKWKQKGGGFNGILKSLTFETKDWESENAKDGEYTTLTAKLSILKDGADEPIDQFVNAGFLYDGQGISKNGKTLTDKNSDDSPIIAGDTNFARLLDTYEEAGGDTASFEKNFLRNFEVLEGQRFAFRNELDKERQIAAGLKKLKAKRGTKPLADGSFVIKGVAVSEAEVMEAGKRQDKNDKKKFYNQNRLTIVQILGDGAAAAASDDDDEEEEKPAKGKASKSKKAPEPDEDEDEADEAEDAGPSNKEAIKFLLGLLKDEDDEIGRSDIPVLVARKLKNKAERDAMSAKLTSVDFLKEENGWSVKGTEKKMVISLDA